MDNAEISSVEVAVSTHVNYFVPLMDCLQSLQDYWPYGVRVFVGGAPTVSTKVFNDVPFYFVTHNSFDYTAMIEYIKMPQHASHVIFLHDTMEVGMDFRRLLFTANVEDEVTAVFGGQCNLALYRTDYLQKRAHEIATLTNCTKKQAIDIEGYFVRTAKRAGSFPGTAIEDREEVFPYGEPRIKVYYSGLDIVKMKANYGQTHEHTGYILKP